MFAISCKKGAAKLDINDVEVHRAYQDSILNQTKSSIEGLQKLQLLIEEYKSLERDQDRENSNLDYYIARLYNNIFYKPAFYLIFDTVSNNVIDTITYIKFKDSARLYAKKSLNVDKNNLYAYALLADNLYMETATFYRSNNRAPFQAIKSINEFTSNLNLVAENAMRLYGIDTSTGKSKGQTIIEYSYYFINMFALKNFNYDNVDYENNSTSIIQLEKYMSVLDKSETFYKLNKKFYLSDNKAIKNIIKIAKIKLEEINKKEQEEIEANKRREALNNINLKHKYSYVNSYAGVSAQLDLWTSSDYVQVTTAGTRGRGIYSREDDILHFTSTSGISLTGDVKIELDKNYNIILTILSTGARYIQDDNGYYIKNNISTTR
jgi:hypothetical protein